MLRHNPIFILGVSSEEVFDPIIEEIERLNGWCTVINEWSTKQYK